jgi:manganese transport protein
MEGYLNLRIRPWVRRVITRILAVAPAVLVIVYLGEHSVSALLILSQVVLSLQLPFAIIPLIHAVADRRRMGEFRIGVAVQALAWMVATIIVALNVVLVLAQLNDWIAAAGRNAWIVQATVIPFTAALGILLLYITVRPWLPERFAALGLPGLVGVHREPSAATKAILKPAPFRRVAVALDFSGKDQRLLAESLRVVDRSKTELTLIHVVESPVAHTLGLDAEDIETLKDRDHLAGFAKQMQRAGIRAKWRLESGDPVSGLARAINEMNADMVIVGSHGHAGVSDLIQGTVISNLRHQIKARMMIVPLGA